MLYPDTQTDPRGRTVERVVVFLAVRVSQALGLGHVLAVLKAMMIELQVAAGFAERADMPDIEGGEEVAERAILGRVIKA